MAGASRPETKVTQAMTGDKESQVRGGAEVARLAHNQKAEGSNPSPATLNEREKLERSEMPSIKLQEDYWKNLPEYECPRCGEHYKVGTIIDHINCSCGATLIVVRDGEYRDGGWRDLTKLVAHENPQG